MSEGWVYVLSNRSIKRQVKIGYSTVSPKARAKDLDTTGVPTPFKLEYEIKVRNCELLEKQVHEKLSEKRVRKGREFFRIDIPTAISVIQELAEDQKIDESIHYKSLEEINQGKLQLEIEKELEEEAKQLEAEQKEIQNFIDEYINNCGIRLKREIDEIVYRLEEKNEKPAFVFSKKQRLEKSKKWQEVSAEISKFNSLCTNYKTKFLKALRDYVDNKQDHFKELHPPYGWKLLHEKTNPEFRSNKNRRVNTRYTEVPLGTKFELSNHFLAIENLDALNFYKTFCNQNGLGLTFDKGSFEIWRHPIGKMILNCSACAQKMRVPKRKNIKVTCPKCNYVTTFQLRHYVED